ncbi:MAG: putative lipid II flippase FtsW [Proteobacteria bacterium]|nr:putative lipid II flippase FtsW [Pseudomonadota bacterium]
MAQQLSAHSLLTPIDGAHRTKMRPPLVADPLLLLVVTALVLFGLVMLYSTTGILSQERMGDEFFYLKRQAAAALVGFAALWGCSRVNLDLLRKVSPILMVISFVLLLITFIPGVGDAAGGAQRWVKLGPVRFQPAEFVKLFFVLFLATYWGRHEDRVNEFSFGILKPVMLSGLVSGLLLLQPDFGSSSIIVLVTLAMALAAGARLLYLGLGFLSVAAAGGLLIIISPYRLARVTTFLTPFKDAAGKGYQLIQSLIAVGSGQLTGVGLGGSQQKLFFLPAAHTDFIFAVVSEELGFIGAVLLIATFLLLLWRGLRIAHRVADNTYLYALAVGLTMLIVVPALLNVGVVTGLLPTKGLVLPLVGFGGSSLITSLAAVGLLLAVAREGNSPR